MARRLPLDLVGELKAAGCFRMFVPAEYGGDELTYHQACQVLEELASADGSTGWTTMIGSETPILLSRLPRRTFETVYADGPDVIGAGALAPKGQAVVVEGGYCLSGQWSFASGCQHASWLLGQATLTENGRPRISPAGVPEMRVAVFPAAQAEILDSWHVAGLQGTGSHDFRVQDAFCSDEWTFNMLTSPPSVQSAAYAIPLLIQLPAKIAAVALGIAQGALDDIAALASMGKRRVFAPSRLAESAVFQDTLGEADATLRAARALFYTDLDAAWAMANRGEALSQLERARMRTMATHVAVAAARVVDIAYTAGGGSAVYEASPLQRRLRDIHTLTQHIGVARDTFAYAGALLAGESLDPRIPV